MKQLGLALEAGLLAEHGIDEAYRRAAEEYRGQKAQAARREAGQFWTPDPVAEFMCRWVTARRPRTILDPGTGPGTFLRFLVRHSPKSAIVAVERDRGLADLARRLLGPFRQIRIFTDDFLAPQQTWPRLGPFDAIVCNPPYMRHHLLGDYKESVRPALEDALGVDIPRKSGCFVYFFYQAVRLLAPGGLLAFITPRLLFEAIYAQHVKEFVAARMRVHGFISFGPGCRVFEEVETAPLIILLEKPRADSQDGLPARLLSVETWPGSDALMEAVQRSADSTWGWGRLTVLPWLDPAARWTTPLTPLRDDLSGIPLVPLGEIARCIRGIATGANKFFALSEAEARRRDLPGRVLRPIVPMMRNAQRLSFTTDHWEALAAEGKRCWLVSLDGGSTRDPAIRRYLAAGRRLGIHRRSLVQTRRRWYTMEQRPVPAILFPLLTQGTPRFVLNDAGVLALNVFHLIYPEASFTEDPVRRKALAALLNSPIVLSEIWRTGRTYGGRTIKLEPRELGRLLVPDPRKLAPAQLAGLAELFDRVADLQAGDAQRQIAEAIPAILGAAPAGDGRGEARPGYRARWS